MWHETFAGVYFSSLRCSRRTHSSNPFVFRLRISTQKLVQISCSVARTYVSFSDRRFSYGFLMHLAIGVILTSAYFAVRSLKPSTEKKKCFGRIPLRQEFASNFADWFSSVFKSLRIHCRVFYNPADSSSVKTNQEIMIFTSKKNYTHVAIQV